MSYDDDLFWHDMEAWLDQDNDEAFHRAMDDLQPPQRGGAAAAAAVEDKAGRAGPSRGHFDFRLDPFVDRRSQRLSVHERIFRARVHQWGTFDHHDQLATCFVEGLRTSLAQMLQDPNITDYFHLASDRLCHAYDGWGLTMGEWRRDQGRVAGLLENLSRMLNSNENFQMDDTFHMSFVHVRAGAYGGGQKCKYLLGHQASTCLKVIKKTVVTIPQTDENLCCARAIVTARAKVENHPQWRAFKRGRQLQLQSAIQLHETSGVRPGPCGADELHQFALALPKYTLVVVDANRAYVCFAYGHGTQLLGILHEDGHYDALTSLPGFFGKGYFCARCPTIMPVNMPAPTIPPIVVVVCRMGALITEKPTPTTSPPPCPAHPVAATSTAPPVWPTTWVSPSMANLPDPDALRSARATRSVWGVSNSCGGNKRGRNTAVGMPHVQPVRRWWTFRPTAASSKWHHHHPRMR